VDKGASLKVVFTAENTSGKEQKLKARIVNFKRLETLDKVSESDSDWITMPVTSSGKTTKFEIVLPNSSDLKPESYLADVRFFNEDGKQLTPVFFFRWVVKGVTGNIISAVSKKDAYNKNERVDLQAMVTGPADSFTDANLDLVAEFFDENGRKSASFSKALPFTSQDDAKLVDFSDQKYSQKEFVSKIVLSLKDGETILSSKEIVFEKRPQAESFLSARNTQIALGIFTLLIFIAIFFWSYFKSKNKSIGQIVFVLGLVGMGMLMGTSSVSASVVVTCPSNNAGFDTPVDVSGESIVRVDDFNYDVAAYVTIFKCFNFAKWTYNSSWVNCAGVSTPVGSDVSLGDAGAVGSWSGIGVADTVRVVTSAKYTKATLSSIKVTCVVNGATGTKILGLSVTNPIVCPAAPTISPSCIGLNPTANISATPASGASNYQFRIDTNGYGPDGFWWENVSGNLNNTDAPVGFLTWNFVNPVNNTPFSGYLTAGNTYYFNVGYYDSSWKHFYDSPWVSFVAQPCFACADPQPANATLCANDDTGLTAAVGKHLVGACSLSNAVNTDRCEYTCSLGFRFDSGTGTCLPNICTGADPTNTTPATLCSGDDIGLIADTPKKPVSGCSVDKCEYTCVAGSQYFPSCNGGQPCCETPIPCPATNPADECKPACKDKTTDPDGTKRVYYWSTDPNNTVCVQLWNDVPCNPTPLCPRVYREVAP